MFTKELLVDNSSGFHVRVATLVCKEVDGEGGKEAFDAIVSLFEHKFYEDEFADAARA